MKRAIASFLCFSLIFTAIAINFNYDVHAATKQELEQKIEKIEEQISANKQKLNELKDKKESQQEYLNTLQSQITANRNKADTIESQIGAIDKEIETFNKQIRQLRGEISDLNNQIKSKNKQINKTKKTIDDSKDQLCDKLRASYIAGNDSNLKILMGSSNLASFLTHLEMMKRMSENDKKMINSFKEKVEKYRKQRKQLEKQEEALSKKQAEVEKAKSEKVASKQELSTKKSEYNTAVRQLESSYSDINAYVQKLDKESQAYKSYISKLEAEKKAADAEIDRIIQSYNASQNKPSASYYTDKSWAWPLGSVGRVESGFGNRSASISGWTFHGGIDITDYPSMGKPIYAAREGTVIAAIWGTSGYGRYLVIDHGDGVTTVYGHCSTLLVSQGQHVSKGQHIANIGDTGNVTGPHLHFEVRVNGVKQNPLNYVSR